MSIIYPLHENACLSDTPLSDFSASQTDLRNDRTEADSALHICWAIWAVRHFAEFHSKDVADVGLANWRMDAPEFYVRVCSLGI